MSNTEIAITKFYLEYVELSGLNSLLTNPREEVYLAFLPRNHLLMCDCMDTEIKIT